MSPAALTKVGLWRRTREGGLDKNEKAVDNARRDEMPGKRTKRRIKLSNQIPKRKAVETPQREILHVGRNEPCPCGSGKKYKDCHISEGEQFLTRIARERRVTRLKAERQDQKAPGVPWYKRIFTKV